MKTEYKNLDGLVIKISQIADNLTSEPELSIEGEGGYFYSAIDKKVHKSTSWISYYYYDEKQKAHPHESVYKVLATSDKVKYKELPLLTVNDLVKN